MYISFCMTIAVASGCSRCYSPVDLSAQRCRRDREVLNSAYFSRSSKKLLVPVSTKRFRDWEH